MNLFHSILQNLGAGLPGSQQQQDYRQATLQGKQTEVAQQKQNLLDQQRSHDADFIQHMDEQGALPVVNGMVKQPMYNEGNPDLGLPPTNGTVLRPADPSRTVKWKDADGNQVAHELPSVEDQKHKFQYNAIMDQMDPAQRAYRAEAANTANTAETNSTAAKTFGTAQGTSQGKAQDFATRAVPIPDVNADALGYPRGYRMTPEQLDSAMNRNVSYRTAGLKDEAADKRNVDTIAGRKDVAETNVAGRQGVADTNVVGREDVAKTNAAARTGRAGNPNQAAHDKAVQDRFNQKRADGLRKENDAHQIAEQQAWGQAQKYQDILNTPEPGMLGSTPTFQDPDKPGSKPQKLNAAQRVILRGRMAKAQALALSHQQAGKNIRQSLGMPPFSNGTQPPPAAPGAAPPAAAAPGDKVMVKTGDGRTGYIPKANFDKAKALDPNLSIVTQ